MTIFIDRTESGGDKHKNLVNRRKFMRRISDKLQKSVKKYIANDADVKSIADGKEKKVKISGKTLDEPIIVHGNDNDKEGVLIGNDQFEKGDTIPKPPSGGSRGGEGSGPDSQEGQDDFYFTMSHKEFVDLFFDDLELPDLIKKQLTEKDTEIRHAGFTTDGPPAKLDLLKTMHNSIKRKYAISGEIDREIERIENILNKDDISNDERNDHLKQIEKLEEQKESIPFLQDLDLRYRRIEHVPIPTTKAVMFCCMDVSYSMQEWHKEMAKRFFMLLYLFLTRQYEDVDIVFVKHHHVALEVDERNFFESTESGGTVVSSAFELINKIIDERYPTNIYNIYLAQASDGDNYNHEGESSKVISILAEMLPKLQYMAYVEIDEYADELEQKMIPEGSELAELYSYIQQKAGFQGKKIHSRIINGPESVYKVFRSLFLSRTKKE